jgi:four helix bundle protein
VAVSDIRSYRDLRVWREAMDLAVACYRLTADFPKSETFGMTSQIRRGSASIAANIAEGYGRQSSGSYVHFLRVAQGSLKELETFLLLSERVGLTSSADIEPLLGYCETVGKMLQSLIRSIETEPRP